jgi:alpha-tubulin suppressor-like RCC1 family protein
LECWGDDSAGQLGKSNSLAATEISTLAAGASRTCALTRDRSVWCWGQYSITFPVRTAGTEPWPPATTVPGLPSDIEQLAGGGDAFCARTFSGKLHCWGYLGIAHGYQYPDASAVPPPSPPHEVTTPAPVREVSMGDHHLCAALQDARVVCLGSDEQRQLGAIMPRQEISNGPCGRQPFEELASSSFVVVAW